MWTLAHLKSREEFLKLRELRKERMTSDSRFRLKRWEIRRRHNEKRRRILLEFLGGKCVRCGFSDHRALQVDHINGGSCKWFKNHRGYNRNSVRFYNMIIKSPKEYQLLCANCNWIKRAENGETRKRKLF